MNPVSLIRLNVGLEYQIVSADNFLTPFPDSSEQGRCVIHRHADEYELFLRADLEPDVRDQLLALPQSVIFNDHARVKQILSPCPSIWIGKSYYFAHTPAASEFPDVVQEGAQCVVKVNDETVSWAWSVRENEHAAEVAVETSPNYRRRGYARQVTAAWASQVVSQGRVAFYSHNHDNDVSAALARSLGLVQYTDGVAYE